MEGIRDIRTICFVEEEHGGIVQYRNYNQLREWLSANRIVIDKDAKLGDRVIIGKFVALHRVQCG